MSSHSRSAPTWNAWMLRRYCSGPGLPYQGAPVWCSETPFGVWGTYGWTGAAAAQASRERTFGGRPASAGAAPGAPRVMLDGENVPSQAGFGEKIGGLAGTADGVPVEGGSPWPAPAG